MLSAAARQAAMQVIIQMKLFSNLPVEVIYLIARIKLQIGKVQVKRSLSALFSLVSSIVDYPL